MLLRPNGLQAYGYGWDDAEVKDRIEKRFCITMLGGLGVTQIIRRKRLAA